MDRDISYIEKINNLDFLKFLKAIGIKQTYINNFNKNVKWNKNNNNLFNFRLYLIYFDKKELVNNENSINDEVISFREFGFIVRYAKYYFNTIEHIYENDTIVNWIYRIIESLMSEVGLNNFCNFVYKCHIENRKEKEECIDDNNSVNNNYFDDGDVITLYAE